MKKIILKSLLAFTMVSLLASSVDAANFITNTSIIVPFVPTITPAPNVVIPFAPVAKPQSISVKEAVKGFSSLSKAEKKSRIKDAKIALKEYKKAKKAGKEPSTNTLLLVILAILLPPLAVYLHEGEINSKFWISLLLTLLFFLPGVIYALIVILGDDNKKN
ncbi:YqaE/Pmp3 family membrane protein [Ferruginibacter yonginensis]|uniref:YqaE/Pmp3 family membrane protein n=1 Tax=Ferruginibacter yonginensis TaxID=1310416 RepID=A0ABV8QMM6_9BACT